jgi:hypothetical protein
MPSISTALLFCELDLAVGLLDMVDDDATEEIDAGCV